MENHALAIIETGYKQKQTNREILGRLKKAGIEKLNGNKVSVPAISMFANKRGLRKVRNYKKKKGQKRTSKQQTDFAEATKQIDLTAPIIKPEGDTKRSRLLQKILSGYQLNDNEYQFLVNAVMEHSK
jgi:hypothetical protein